MLVPLFFSLSFTQAESAGRAGIIFLAFCLAASFIYIVNDIADREHDRRHPKKFRRPIASGAIGVPAARIAAGTCLLACLALLAGLGDGRAAGAVIAYLVLNLGYSWRLKHVPLIDVFCIALGFVLRVYAGAYAIGVAVSNYLFLVTLFLSLFLAFCKRWSELKKHGASGTRKVLNGYSLVTLDRYIAILAGGVVVSYALYTQDAVTLARFGGRLVYSVVFVLYGLFRYMSELDRTSDYDDPTENLYKDKALIATCGVYVLYVAIVAL
ncbi:MAG: UbiA prenyltransferase family protein, partial [Candidatus Accumulibacter sp.]|nr:UbiA prenyltransferase family protein [Accumulibacter sp.]